MNKQEAILNKLIELKQVYITDDLYVWDSITKESLGTKVLFNVMDWNATFLCLQRALFDECGKLDILITIDKNEIYVERRAGHAFNFIYSGDTSRQSFLQAFCKVVGIK